MLMLRVNVEEHADVHVYVYVANEMILMLMSIGMLMWRLMLHLTFELMSAGLLMLMMMLMVMLSWVSGDEDGHFFSGDRFATSMPWSHVKSLDAAVTECASKRAHAGGSPRRGRQSATGSAAPLLRPQSS